mmetsp:Transcript_83163/g.269236  ORF Transcript_83163/g.269236 Transcript_83163/m.269236 type:complete len:263 (-) Transcript_83163:289-1077(-)
MRGLARRMAGILHWSRCLATNRDGQMRPRRAWTGVCSRWCASPTDASTSRRSCTSARSAGRRPLPRLWPPPPSGSAGEMLRAPCGRWGTPWIATRGRRCCTTRSRTPTSTTRHCRRRFATGVCTRLELRSCPLSASVPTAAAEARAVPRRRGTTWASASLARRRPEIRMRPQVSGHPPARRRPTPGCGTCSGSCCASSVPSRRPGSSIGRCWAACPWPTLATSCISIWRASMPCNPVPCRSAPLLGILPCASSGLFGATARG